jgi:hypothetical protein
MFLGDLKCGSSFLFGDTKLSARIRQPLAKCLPPPSSEPLLLLPLWRNHISIVTRPRDLRLRPALVEKNHSALMAHAHRRSHSTFPSNRYLLDHSIKCVKCVLADHIGRYVDFVARVSANSKAVAVAAITPRIKSSARF